MRKSIRFEVFFHLRIGCLTLNTHHEILLYYHASNHSSMLTDAKFDSFFILINMVKTLQCNGRECLNNQGN